MLGPQRSQLVFAFSLKTLNVMQCDTFEKSSSNPELPGLLPRALSEFPVPHPEVLKLGPCPAEEVPALSPSPGPMGCGRAGGREG